MGLLRNVEKYISKYFLAVKVVVITIITGWIPVKKGKYIYHDLERTPLQIKTDSATGSKELIRAVFYNEAQEFVGYIDIEDQQYRLRGCSRGIYDSLETLPSVNVKEWKIIMVTSASDVRITIQCNGGIVKEFQMSSCVDSTWSTTWLQEVKIIRIGYVDTASDYIYYSPGLKTD